jgi:soluble lytic murein transglycosylase-like protein
MERHRRKLLLLAALALASLSCAVVPRVAPPSAPVLEQPASPPTAEVPEVRAEPDPVLEAVHAQLARRVRGLTDAEVERLARTVVAEARRYDFDPGLVLAVMHVESRFDTYAMSPVQALGLMQIMPETGEEMAIALDIPWRGPQTLFDPFANVRIGVAYLRQLTDRYGSLATALSAYNWGPGRIDRRLRRGAPVPTVYATSVLEAYGETANRS